MGSNIKFHNMGSLYIGGRVKNNPLQPTSNGDIPYYNGRSAIEISDTVHDFQKDIAWIQLDGQKTMMAERVILSKVSWNDLHAAGFVAGKRVLIDGRWYLCRLPGVAIDKSTGESEWSNILKETSLESTIWHWKNMFTIGRETYRTKDGLECPIVGFDGPLKLSSCKTHALVILAGFRPVLEELTTGKAPFGKELSLDGQQFYAVDTKANEDSTDFQPTLYPIKDGKPNDKVFWSIPDGETLSMYTLLMNGEPVKQGRKRRYVKGSNLTLTDRYYGDEFLMKWTIIGGKAVATKPVLTNICEEDIARQGFFGQELCYPGCAAT